MSFYNTTPVQKTRKPRACWWCGQRIEAGSRAYYKSWVYEGDFSTGYWHPECHAAEQKFHADYPGEDTYRASFTRGRSDDETLPPMFSQEGERIQEPRSDSAPNSLQSKPLTASLL